MATSFSGFGPDTLGFLRGLSAHNDKAWFDAHRKDYEAHYLKPAIAFVAAAAEPLSAMLPGINAEPRVNGSIFRVNRDIRFSKDKTPYKDHIDFWFWEGERKTALSGLFMRLTASELILGVGCHMMDAARLKAYRDAVADPKSATALGKAVATVEAAGHTVKGEHYKTLPRGYAAPTATAERLLKFNALYAADDLPHPPTLGSPDFVGTCVEHWRGCLPIHRWLVTTLR